MSWTKYKTSDVVPEFAEEQRTLMTTLRQKIVVGTCYTTTHY